MAGVGTNLRRSLTFARFVAGRLKRRKALTRELVTAGAGEVGPNALAGIAPEAVAAHATVLVKPGPSSWSDTGVAVRSGQTFTVRASGVVWLSQPLALGFEPRVALWVRIGGKEPIRKLLSNETSYRAWADGTVELFVKALGEWKSPAGDLLPGPGGSLEGQISALVVAWADGPDRGFTAPREPEAPDDWFYLWRLGDGSIFKSSGDDEIEVGTHGDVGILQRDVDVPLTPDLRLDWRWLIDALPSHLPEDLQPTHDYISIAVEFENGLDLTYMWSAGLPEGHVFTCPLPWWCERETHLVARSGAAGLGRWHSESRLLAEDYRRAIGPDLPSRVVRVWLIANSVFQRNEGRARFADIRLVGANT